MEQGISTGYSLDTIQERGRLFIGPQAEIYEGMIIGENARPDDMPVNPCKAKKLTNMRSQGDGKGISLAPPLKMTLERALEYIAPDEYVEATPKSLRLRKKILDATTPPTPTPDLEPQTGENKKTASAPLLVARLSTERQPAPAGGPRQC